MNPKWFVHNVTTSWRYRASIGDFLRRMLWIYADRIPDMFRPHEQTISFRFPAPIATIRVLLRSNAGADAFIFGEVFHHQYYRLPLKRSPTTILDLGANIGLTAVYFARTYPTANIACVEPMPENIRVFERNRDLNAIDARLFSAAAVVDDGPVFMEVGVKDYGHKVASDTTPASANAVKVDGLSVPSIMRLLGWERIGLLKVDIEGHEAALLSGDCRWLRLVDTVCIECHDGFGESDLQRIAHDYGFRSPERLPGAWLITRD